MWCSTKNIISHNLQVNTMEFTLFSLANQNICQEISHDNSSHSITILRSDLGIKFMFTIDSCFD